MNINDVQKAAWDTKQVVNFLRAVPVGAVKSTLELADEFITSFGVNPNDSGFYGVLNNMCAGFDFLHSLGDVTVIRNDEGVPILTFVKNSGLYPL